MKKTSKLITIILIIMIIAVVGLASYYGYSYLKNKKTDKEALKEVDDFNINIPTITLAEYEDKVKKGIIKEDDEKNNTGNSGGSYNNIGGGGHYTQAELDRMFKPRVIGTIRIPKTSIRYPIYSPSGENVLERGIGMLTTDKGLNRAGNTTLQGHNWRNWMFFSRNHLLKNGDSIYIKDNRGVEVEYVVYKKMNLKPTDSKYITRDTKGKKEISLSTCTNLARDRLVVLAREK